MNNMGTIRVTAATNPLPTEHNATAGTETRNRLTGVFRTAGLKVTAEIKITPGTAAALIATNQGKAQPLPQA